MPVYLIHFDEKLSHAQHYIGFAKSNVIARLRKHENGTGARIMQVVGERGISWRLAKVWPEGDRNFERQLKGWHGAAPLCPICKAEKNLETMGLEHQFGFNVLEGAAKLL